MAVQADRRPAPLAGVPLSSKTELHLVIPGKPPYLLDVDTNRITPLRVLTSQRRDLGVSVTGVGNRTAVVVAERAQAGARIYAVNRNNVPRTLNLGSGAAVAPAVDNRSIWVKHHLDRSACSLGRVALDGRAIRKPRAFPCDLTISPGSSLGLVVSRTSVINPSTGKIVFTTPLDAFKSPLGIVAITATRILLEDGPNGNFTVLNRSTGAQRQFRWPSILGGLDQAAVDSEARWVALSFANPSWTSPAGQAFDIWLLNIDTGTMLELPGMPTFIALKMTSMQWTPDGRLVLLAESKGKNLVVAWRPGQSRLALKTEQLPDRSTSGSDSFALIR